MTPRRYLAGCLFALALLFAGWAVLDDHLLAGLLAFALPPALLGFGALRDWPRISFLAAVVALLWFSHGVMLLWAEPALRLPALAETLLALLVIHAACLPGYRARRGVQHP